MPILLCTIVLFLMLTWLLIIYFRRIGHFKKHVLPHQLAIVNQLQEELYSSKILLSVCAGSDVENPHAYTLFEIARFIEDNYRFSNEMYDDYGVFFTANSRQIIDLDKYMASQLLPKDIKDELKAFYNKGFKPPVKPSKPFFKIDLPGEINTMENNVREFFGGTAEAFENWLAFKESADNLGFVIEQWIKDHSEK